MTAFSSTSSTTLRDLINKAITSGLDSTQEGLIRASAKALCSLFNDAADKLGGHDGDLGDSAQGPGRHRQ